VKALNKKGVLVEVALLIAVVGLMFAVSTIKNTDTGSKITGLVADNETFVSNETVAGNETALVESLPAEEIPAESLPAEMPPVETLAGEPTPTEPLLSIEGAITPDASTVGLWYFDKGTGFLANDSSGRSNHGALEGNSYCFDSGGSCDFSDPSFCNMDQSICEDFCQCTWAAGSQASGPTWTSSSRFGSYALNFDGKNDYVLVNGSSSLFSPFVTGNITMAAWIYLKTFSGPAMIYGTNSQNWCVGGIIEADSNGFRGGFQKVDTNEAIISSFPNISISLNRWYHVAWTYSNGSQLRLYVNGTQVNNMTPAITMDDVSQLYNLEFGTSAFAGASGGGVCGGLTYFNGTIDQVVIYNRTLSAAEILNLYQVSNDTPNYSNFNGSTTNFGGVSDIANVLRPIIENTNYGKIQWNGNINASNANFGNIQLGNNFVRINSSALNPSFNTSANITLYTLSYASALPLWDPEDDGTFVPCPSSVCTNVTYVGGAGGNLSFTVTHFTTYSGGGAVGSCGTLATAGYYMLTTNVVTAVNCMQFGDNDITLDCQGYSITGGGGFTWGIEDDQSYTNSVVKNCRITNFNNGIQYVGSNGLFSNNTIVSNSQYGISMGEGSSSNVITNNNLSSNSDSGLYLSVSANNNITNNIINSNTNYGMFIWSASNNNLFVNNTAQNNGWDFTSGLNSVNTVINLTTQQNLVSFASKDISLKGLTTLGVPADSASNKNITKYLNITNNIGTGSWIYLNVSYNATNIPAGVSESSLKIWKYNTTSTNWQLANTSSSANGVDLVNKFVYANITEFGSTFAPLGELTPTTITCPATLSSPGTYNLTQNISSAGSCIIINASDVSLDCQGYMINGIDASSSYGIDNSGGYDNVTIKNCIVKDFERGIWYNNGANNGLIQNNTINSNDWYGILLGASIGTGAHNNTLTDNKVISNNVGVYLYDSHNNTIIKNNVSANGGNGFHIAYALNNSFENNTINSNGGDGIYLYPDSSYNSFENNIIISNSRGILLISNSNNNMFTNNNASGNSQWDLYSEQNSLNNVVVNLSTQQNRISFTSKDIALKGLTTAGVPADSSGYKNITKYLNITNNSATSWLFLNISYSDGDVAGINESTLKLYKYNTSSSSWTSSFGNINAVYEANNIVYANISEFGSTFAPLGQTPADNLPNAVLISPANATITTNTTLIFMANVNDDINLANATLWHNIGGSWQLNDSWHYGNLAADPDTMGLWHFDEGSGTTAADSSSNENNGTLANSPVWNSSSKLGSYALDFDGVDDYASVPDSATLDIDSSYSYELWFKSNSTSNLVAMEKGTNELFVLQPAGGGILYYGHGSAFSSDTPIYDGQFHHLAIVYNLSSTTLQLYVDGELFNSTFGVSAPVPNDDPLYIGSRGGSEYFWPGTLDEFAIYNRSLSAEEIKQHYQRKNYATSDTVNWTIDNIPVGTYSWNIQAFDSADQSNWSEANWTFTIAANATYTTFNGSTTDFNNVPDITNVSQPILEKTGLGKIVWNGNVNAAGSDFDAYANISANFVRINSSALHSSFNTSANVTLYGLSFTNPIPRWDPEDDGSFTDCPLDVCSIINYDVDGNFTFNVSHFTGYSAAENASVAGTGLLVCGINQTSCDAGYTDVLHLSALENAHAELPNETSYNYKVCCKDANGTVSIGNSTGAAFLKLSSSTNAHVEESSQANYNYLAYISASSGGVSCSYSTSCTPTQACLATISGATNAHIADCITNPYATQLCCELTQNIISGAPYTINTSDIYILNQSINVSGDGITINASNATLDCAGYSITGNGSGIGIQTEFDNVIVQNCIITNFSTGILFANNILGTITNNAVNLTIDGLFVSNSSNNTISSNSIEFSAVGITLDSATDSLVNDNAIDSNSNYGIYLSSSANNTFEFNAAENNDWDFYSEAGSLDNAVINLTTQQNLVSFNSKDIALKGLTIPQAPASPAGYSGIGKYLNATNNSADSWLSLNISYANGDLGGVDENDLRVWKYNGSWIDSGFYNINNVDAANNIVYVNITNFGSTFAPLADTQAPGWSDNKTYPASPTTYSPSQNYQFNITWSDNVAVDAVLFEHNFTGSAANYSPSGSSSSEYFYNHSSLVAGSYYWKSYANDSSGNLNLTDAFSYVVNQATPSCSLAFDPAGSATYNETVNASCSCANPETAANLYRNATNVTATENNIPIIIPAGTWSYVCNSTTTQNYTYAENSSSYTINKAASSLTLSITPSLSENYSTITTANCTASTPQITAELYRNGTFIGGSYETATLSAGSYNYSCNATATQNYTAPAAQSNILNITRAPTTTELRLNGSRANLTVTYPTQANATANTSALSVNLYRNGTLVATGNPAINITIPAAGSYNYTAINPGNENYTGSNESWFATINQATPSCSLAFDPINGSIYPVSVNASCSCDNPETAANLFRSAINVTLTENNIFTPLTAGTYNYICNSTATQNYTYAENSSSYTINKADPSPYLNLTLNGNEADAIITYGNQSNTTGRWMLANSQDLTFNLYRNNVLANGNNGALITLAAGEYYYVYNTTGGANYTQGASPTRLLNVTKAASTLTLNITPSLSETYGNTTTANCTSSTPQITAELYRNGAFISGAYESLALAAGSYNYSCNATAAQNYTAPAAQSSILAINRAASSINLYLNGSASNFTRVARHVVNITSALTTPASGIVEIFEDGTSLGAGNSPKEILRNYTTAGLFNITAVYNQTQNYSSNSATHFLTIIAAANYSNFDGNTTDFNEAPNISNVCQPVLEVVANGRIVWTGCVNATGADFDRYVGIGSNSIAVNSSALDQSFNSSANITIYGLALTDPKVQVDYDDNGTFVDCPASLCTEINYTGSNTGNKNFTFNAAHFTTYKAVETPVSGGGGGGKPGIGDINPPVIVFVLPNPGDHAVLNSTEVEFWVNITDESEIATAVLEFDNFKKSMKKTDGKWSYALSGIEDGTYSYRVFAEDKSGNRGYSESRVLTIKTAPVLERPAPIVEAPELPEVPAPEKAAAQINVCALLPPIAYAVAVLILLSLTMYALFTYGLHKEHRKGWLYLAYSLVIFDVIVLGYHWLSCKELLIPAYVVVVIAAFLPVLAAMIPPKKSSDMLLKEAVKKNFRLGFSEKMIKMSLESRGWNKKLVNDIVRQARRELIEEGSLK
jgi:parallel beta-helix repeat protein